MKPYFSGKAISEKFSVNKLQHLRGCCHWINLFHTAGIVTASLNTRAACVYPHNNPRGIIVLFVCRPRAALCCAALWARGRLSQWCVKPPPRSPDSPRPSPCPWNSSAPLITHIRDEGVESLRPSYTVVLAHHLPFWADSTDFWVNSSFNDLIFRSLKVRL